MAPQRAGGLDHLWGGACLHEPTGSLATLDHNIEFYIDWKYTNTNHETVELMHGFDQ